MLDEAWIEKENLKIYWTEILNMKIIFFVFEGHILENGMSGRKRWNQ